MRPQVRSSEFGRLEASPCRVLVVSRSTFTLRYTAGNKPLAAGARIRLLVSRHFPPPNTVGGWSSGYTWIAEKPETVDFEVAIEPAALAIDGHLTTDAVLTVIGGCLQAGEQVVVQYGGDLSKVVAPRMASKAHVFDALVDPDGSRSGPHEGYWFCEAPAPVETFPETACRMEAFIPSTAQSGDPPSTVLVVQKDAYHNVVSATTRAATGPGCRPVRSGNADVWRVEVRDDEAGLNCRSNPAVEPTADGRQLVWGDLHAHTNVSDACAAAESPEDALNFARDTMGLDFVAITHAARNTTGEEWAALLDLVRQHTDPDGFVAFPSFEFYTSEPPGRPWGRLDRVVVFRNSEVAQLPQGMGYDDFRPIDNAAFLEAMDTSVALIIPHMHPGGDWQGRNREKMRLVEIYSQWGCFEREDCKPRFCMSTYPPGGLVSEALSSGIKLGFVAGSDDHTGHPGNSFFWLFGNCPGGLTAVWATERSQEGIWRALHERHCYATTRARIAVRFSVNGGPMGSELRLSSPTEPRRIEAEVHGTADIDAIAVVRNGASFASTAPSDPDVQVAFADDTAIPDGETWYYYLRVEQADGEMAWVSPVWVSA
jgi:hypothetical protein